MSALNLNKLRTLGSALALLLLLGTGCAMQQKPALTAAPPPKEYKEVAELEKTIADRKAGLRGGADQKLSAVAPESAPTPMSAGTPPSARCDGVCRAGQEICTASRRICKIATQLADNVVTTSCQRAQRECTEASSLCAQCR